MKKVLTITILTLVLTIMSVGIARAEWLPLAPIFELASKGDGDNFIRINRDGAVYTALTPIHIYHDPNDWRIADPKHVKNFLAQLMMAYSLNKELRVEVYQRNITLGDGSNVSAWVMEGLLFQ